MPSFSPFNPQELYLSSDMGEVFHSKTLGASWDYVDFHQLNASGLGSRVEFTNNPSILYALDGTFNQRPARSTDGGVTWSRAGTAGWPSNWNSGRNADQLYVDLNDANRLVIAADSNLYFSNDGGTTFTAKYADATGRGMRGSGAFFDGQTIYVGTNNGLLVSTDNGSTFAPATLGGNPLTGIPNNEAIFSFAGAKQGNTTRFYCVTLAAANVAPGIQVPPYLAYKGVYALDWQQTDWVPKTTGLTAAEYPTFVAMSHNDISTAYVAGVTTPGIQPFASKTTDGGNHWQLNFNITNNQNIVTGYAGTAGDYPYGASPLGFSVSPVNANEACLTTGYTAHYSVNGGQLWQQMYVDPSSQNPAGSTTPKRRYYANDGLNNTTAWWVTWADQNNLVSGYTDILGARSSNGGNTWGFDHSGWHTFNGNSTDMNET